MCKLAFFSCQDRNMNKERRAKENIHLDVGANIVNKGEEKGRGA